MRALGETDPETANVVAALSGRLRGVSRKTIVGTDRKSVFGRQRVEARSGMKGSRLFSESAPNLTR